MRPSETLTKNFDALYRKLRNVQRAGLQRHLPRGVTLAEAKVVRAVERVGHQGVSVIAQYLDLSHPSTANLIARLRERGLIAIQQAGAADGRKKRLRVTVKGKEIEDAFALAEKDSAEMFLTALTREEQASFVALLDKLLAGAAFVPDDAPKEKKMRRIQKSPPSSPSTVGT